ncbi:hypothetical protein EW146_g7441 [Bondarzewia mesenterica]|uniref:GST C-terminal domain-containing protein n=1 Tax=Bondarzewia mesenterica TaxID=1095465 RepID=A0A4S4LRF2_9AGAM|nr:hypothetical protein EW146_g7441 [Bondarzewia mesenterica]
MSTALIDEAALPVVNRAASQTTSSYGDEKREYSAPQEVKVEESFETADVTKPFPIDPNEPEEEHQLTFRALLVGCILGAVVGASNIYLGLKTGFTFGPQLFGAIFGFAILKPISRVLPESGLLGRFLGGPFGPKENCTVQTAATASGGLGILFVSAVPAMYRLNLLSDKPQQDVGRLIALTVTAGFFGVFFVIPLRKHFIVHQKLTFPTPAATAYTIRALHNGRTGAIAAKKKSLGLIVTLISAFLFKVVSLYAPGIVWDWHIGWTLYRIGFTSIISLENYGWWIEFTPAFFGAGQLSGMNASWSFFGGAVLAWGIIAPSLIATGRAVGIPVSNEFPLISYLGMNFASVDDFVNNPSPRYWLLWPGVFMMLLYSAADVIIGAAGPVYRSIRSIQFTGGRNPFKWFSDDDDGEDEDLTPKEDRIPNWAWTGGLFVSIVMSCALLATQFHVNVGEAILALILAFLFSFIGVQSSGYTDVNPISTVAKASQLIFGGIGKGQGLALRPAEMLNLSAGVVSAGAAAQAVDMTGDLKTGYLLRAKPKNQFVAQLVGAVVAVFLTSGLFILFTTASPCIIHPPADGKCTYGAPSVSAWAAVALAVASPKLPIPSSSGYTAIALGIFSVISVVAKHFLIPKKHWHWVPNWNAVGLAFVVPQVYYPIAMIFGATFNYIWQRRNPASYDMYMFPISAGLLAGEGLGGVFGALLAVAGVDGSKFGTIIGCPGLECAIITLMSVRGDRAAVYGQGFPTGDAPAFSVPLPTSASTLMISMSAPARDVSRQSDIAKMTVDSDGSFKRLPSVFRNSVEKGGQFPPENGETKSSSRIRYDRYHLYVSYACPWATRTLIMRKLKGLEDIIGEPPPFSLIVRLTRAHAMLPGVSVVSPHMGDQGWPFASADKFPGADVDPLYNAQHIKELYLRANPEYSGRFTVPVLWDKKQHTIVNNESSEIIRIFNTAFNGLIPKEKAELDFYPEELRKEIDSVNEWVYDAINSAFSSPIHEKAWRELMLSVDEFVDGVYKSGFATTFEAYRAAVIPLFEALDRIEKMLKSKTYLIGDRLSEADIRLFVTIVRFDPVYVGHFKCNIRTIRGGYPNIHLWLRRLYWQNYAFQSTTDFEHIKTHYYWSHPMARCPFSPTGRLGLIYCPQINPYRIVPIGPVPHIEPL